MSWAGDRHVRKVHLESCQNCGFRCLGPEPALVEADLAGRPSGSSSVRRGLGQRGHCLTWCRCANHVVHLVVDILQDCSLSVFVQQVRCDWTKFVYHNELLAKIWLHVCGAILMSMHSSGDLGRACCSGKLSCVVVCATKALALNAVLALASAFALLSLCRALGCHVRFQTQVALMRPVVDALAWGLACATPTFELLAYLNALSIRREGTDVVVPLGPVFSCALALLVILARGVGRAGRLRA